MRQERNIVAINGSPHRAVGNTSRMLDMLRGPLTDAGFGLEEVFLAEPRVG